MVVGASAAHQAGIVGGDLPEQGMGRAAPPRYEPRRTSEPFHLLDFVSLGAAGGGDFNAGAFSVSDQCAGQG